MGAAGENRTAHMTIWQTLRAWWLGADPQRDVGRERWEAIKRWHAEASPPGDGWKLWCYISMHSVCRSPLDSPYSHECVSIWRQGWEQPRSVKPYELPDWFNVAGLYWKPTPYLEREAQPDPARPFFWLGASADPSVGDGIDAAYGRSSQPILHRESSLYDWRAAAMAMTPRAASAETGEVRGT